MTHRWRPLAAIAPLLAAAAVLCWREGRAAATPAAVAVHAGRTAVALPVPPTFRGATGQTLQLDPARSSARFCIHYADGDLVLLCPAVDASLDYDTAGQPELLHLRLDLDQLVTPQGAPATTDRWHLLGVRSGETVTFRGRVLAIESYPIAGTSRIRWAGPLQFGSSVRSAVIDLFCAQTTPRRCRLQGLGRVDTTALGLPRRYHLGLWPEHHDITLALDLAFATRTP